MIATFPQRDHRTSSPGFAATPESNLTFDDLAHAYLEDYELQRYRSLSTAKPRVGHLRSFFDGWSAEHITGDAVRQYQL